MHSLPVFVTLAGRAVIVLGEGEAAEAKRRLIMRAGGVPVDDEDAEARLAFVAIDDEVEALAAVTRLKVRGLLVNAVDRLALCDFTTPAIVDRNPVLIAVSTGGASAGLAKALRQRLEALLPAGLGHLASALKAARGRIAARWREPTDRRRAIDAALAGPLDPFKDAGQDALERWLAGEDSGSSTGLMVVDLSSDDPDDLTLRQARWLGAADALVCKGAVAPAITMRARADARRVDDVPATLPPGELWVLLHRA